MEECKREEDEDTMPVDFFCQVHRIYPDYHDYYLDDDHYDDNYDYYDDDDDDEAGSFE